MVKKPVKTVEDAWRKLQLRVALAALSEEQEQALTLRYLDGEKVRTYAEVGEALGITAEAVRQRCERGLQAARQIYNDA